MTGRTRERTCIVTRQVHPAGELVRFVVGPDGVIVPDLKGQLPGRGCWVSADRQSVDRAAGRNLFARALKTAVTVPADLGAMVDRLLAKSALGALGLCRKAGAVALGAAKVEAAVRSGKAAAVLHAADAAPDGVRKMDQARRAVVYAGGPDIPAYKLFPEAELGLAFGASNVIHAAVLASGVGQVALGRLAALGRYRGELPMIRNSDAALAAEDT